MWKSKRLNTGDHGYHIPPAADTKLTDLPGSPIENAKLYGGGPITNPSVLAEMQDFEEEIFMPRPPEDFPYGDSAKPDDPINPKDIIGAKKVPMGYIPPAAVLYMTLAMWNGGHKYGPFNWREGGKVQASIYLDAIFRHLLLWQSGEEIADDSEVPHLGHVMAGLAILIDAYEGEYLHDDRPKNQYDFAKLLKEWNAKASALLEKWDKQKKK